MNKKITILLITLWMNIIVISGCGMMPHVNASAQTMVNSKKELIAEVEEALSNGETEVSFTTKELGQKDFDTLNQQIEGFYGTVKEYQIKTVKFLNKSYVTLNCEISDNYYVEKAFLMVKRFQRKKIRQRICIKFARVSLLICRARSGAIMKKKKRYMIIL